MLYQTRHPFFFSSFNPFSTSISNPPPASISATAPPPPPAEGEMEGVEGALKSSSLGPDMAAKKSQQPGFVDDVGQTDVSGDDFFVDDLLDFSKGGVEDGDALFEAKEEEPEHEEEETRACSVSVQEQKKETDFDPCSELSVPADDLANLEWLSHFVEDSFSGYSLTCAAGKLAEKPADNRPGAPEIPAPAKPQFTTPIQTKARSKRARTGGRVWSLGSPSLTESSSTSSSSTSSTLSSSPSISLNPWLICASPSQTAESVNLLGPAQPAKKLKKKKQETPSTGGGGSQQPRRCSHCLVQKTPQWRAGPLGAKTLCNACGVRYKSGRLFPEYRPACSPTFSSEIHSNNHRKVLEMRRKKELGGGPPVAAAVQSF
ncbi:GATA transcription factor 5 [Diospyros lotus]|uniref:GATA transcription factor 5 n=1 Tax=Diospyros lotus TaxID=55363 RepID=UPI0022598DD2|nr:GATA transcription factor 5 [Diospyros lotus]